MDELERTVRRERAREELARLEPGGSPLRPIVVASAAVIEGRAASLPCPHCGPRPEAMQRIVEHTRPMPGLRRVDVACRHCSLPRALWFALVPALANPNEPN